MSKVYTRFQTKTAKTLPFGAARTYTSMAYKREYPTPNKARTTAFLENSDR